MFTDNLQLARVRDYPKVVEFARQMRSLIVEGSAQENVKPFLPDLCFFANSY